MSCALLFAALVVTVYATEMGIELPEEMDMDVPLPVHNEHYMNYILNLIDEFAPDLPGDKALGESRESERLSHAEDVAKTAKDNIDKRKQELAQSEEESKHAHEIAEDAAKEEHHAAHKTAQVHQSVESSMKQLSADRQKAEQYRKVAKAKEQKLDAAVDSDQKMEAKAEEVLKKAKDVLKTKKAEEAKTKKMSVVNAEHEIDLKAAEEKAELRYKEDENDVNQAKADEQNAQVDDTTNNQQNRHMVPGYNAPPPRA